MALLFHVIVSVLAFGFATLRTELVDARPATRERFVEGVKLSLPTPWLLPSPRNKALPLSRAIVHPERRPIYAVLVL